MTLGFIPTASANLKYNNCTLNSRLSLFLNAQMVLTTIMMDVWITLMIEDVTIITIMMRRMHKLLANAKLSAAMILSIMITIQWMIMDMARMLRRRRRGNHYNLLFLDN